MTTPIGFKYAGEMMLQRKVLLGGEESGGIGIGAQALGIAQAAFEAAVERVQRRFPEKAVICSTMGFQLID